MFSHTVSGIMYCTPDLFIVDYNIEEFGPIIIINPECAST